MRNILFIVSVFFFAACGNESEQVSATPAQQESPDSLFQYVMEEHNVAMAKVKKVRGYRAQADKKIDSLKKVKKPTEALTTLSGELKSADENMDKWMKEFSLDSAQEGANEKRINYLNAEKVKVTKVKEEILSVLAKADTMLSK
jgi:hypothetical protein